MDYSLINKYLAGEASEAEVKEVFLWTELDSRNRKELIQYKKIWALTAKSAENSDKGFSNILAKTTRQMKSKLHTYYTYARYAAIVLIVFSMGIIVQSVRSKKSVEEFYLAETKIEVPAGQMSNVVLCDGTTVLLNSGSKLIYPANYNSGERVVNLEGEAFFVVKKDPVHPFFVQTSTLSFKVYGTSFNIQAYPEDNEINTTLVEGSLGVINKNGNELTKLVPGENVKYMNKTNKLILSTVNTDLYTSWKEGLITFKNEKLKDIARKIERWYNVEIVIQNSKLEDELYMGTIMKNKPVDQILEVLSLTSSLNYRIIPRADKPALVYWN